MTAIERIARAIDPCSWDDENWQMFFTTVEERTRARIASLNHAQAALEAMLEPSDDMLDQGAQVLDSKEFVSPYEVWQAMMRQAIKAAIAER